MPQIVEYRVVSVVSVSKLQEAVGLYMKEGWQPLGGVSISTGSGYAQALVKYAAS
jgi:hypothetical protein